MKISNSNDIPSSVYRLQLSNEFTIKKATQILPYLKELGLDGVYTSPFYDAYTPHGYDVTNPNAYNPQIGTNEEFEDFYKTLKELNIKLIIDVIPNHMGIKGGKNLWWQDVLEHGPYSECATFFDIDWSPEKKELNDRVILPILGESYGKVLENKQIQLFLNGGTFHLQYMDFPLPVKPESYALILAQNSDQLKEALGEGSEEWLEYLELVEFYRFFPIVPGERIQKNVIGRELFCKLLKKSKKIEAHLHLIVSLYNEKSLDWLDKLLEAQFYRLSYWKVASHEINYRRFFNINELVAIRIEEQVVLDLHHRMVFDLMEEDKVQGLRIDHPDGLYDPIRYFERLRKRLPLFTVVEKILDRKEELSNLWQVEGTVGYEYLNLLNGLFINSRHEKEFTSIYEEFIGKKVALEEVIYQSKKKIARNEMASEVEALGLKLDRLSEQNREFRDFTRHDLTLAIAEVLACFPVYRTYIDAEGKIERHDSLYIKKAIEIAKRKAETEIDPSIFDYLEKMLLVKLKSPEGTSTYLEFALRFQQLSGPLMAKGLEDTAFYIYNRFLSLNEVGGDPLHFGHSPLHFHKFNEEKKEKWPFGFLASSTHDTKRSEDARSRLNVISEMPKEWKEAITSWSVATQKFKTLGPTPNAEYFIYQTLLAIWPNEKLEKGDWEKFQERVWDIILKCLREAKEETGWLVPNQLYEEAVRNFLASILSLDKENPFLPLFLPFQKKIAALGALNSLSSIVLKLGSCGVVDIYQGNEVLTYRLVDPDNRVLIDFDSLEKKLKNIKKVEGQKLLNSKDFSKIKMYLHWKGLHFRNQNKSLFLDGEYIPLEVEGDQKNHIIAFMRKLGGQFALILAARFFASFEDEKSTGNSIWGDTQVILPATEMKSLKDLFSQENVEIHVENGTKKILIAEAFQHLPVSILF